MSQSRLLTPHYELFHISTSLPHMKYMIGEKKDNLATCSLLSDWLFHPGRLQTCYSSCTEEMILSHDTHWHRDWSQLDQFHFYTFASAMNTKMKTFSRIEMRLQSSSAGLWGSLINTDEIFPCSLCCFILYFWSSLNKFMTSLINLAFSSQQGFGKLFHVKKWLFIARQNF